MKDRNRKPDFGEGRKQPPPTETHAENYYYKKQIDGRTRMTFVLHDGEELTGVIDWYDRSSLKINRENGPKLLLYKKYIKYMFKADDDS
ncbi:MAG: hypothetical protein KIS76_04350 [Pyrinomonadaceae bacterium]|nr:hypothetical protein [Pyrinomonadaceae bacterium]